MNSEIRTQHAKNGVHSLKHDGFEILADFFPVAESEILADELSMLHLRLREASGNKLGGLRNLLKIVPKVNELANSPPFRTISEDRLGKTAFPVRALFFDKTPDANWKVAWHQDLSIAVVDKIEISGFEAWSVKEGIVHVQPPRQVMEKMLTVRLHLDDCNMDNGPLKVIPGSHVHGKIASTQIAGWIEKNEAITCEVPKGGALLMHPLILHSSSPSKIPSHRRVLHIEFAADDLPNGLEWYERQ